MSDQDEQRRDYRSTIILPKTEFAMRAGLPTREPVMAERWRTIDLYARRQLMNAASPLFVLHDGPPYANGDIHMGHALNKVLKDSIVRAHSMTGRRSPFVPGWDCHGLPIEWKVEQSYRDRKIAKEDVDPVEFRTACRDYARGWVKRQSDQFQRLGVMADWNDPYLTMSYANEAAILGEFLKFAESGQLYRGAKPVMWSPVEGTALADAEVEEKPAVLTQVDVLFPVRSTDHVALLGAHMVVWTTTPWTLPSNQAVAVGPEMEYAALKVGDRTLVMATASLASPRYAHFADADTVWTGRGSDLSRTTVGHPMSGLGGFMDEERPVLVDAFVREGGGTGVVHLASDHGEIDFEVCRKAGLSPVFATTDKGRYRDDWPWLAGQGSVIADALSAPDGPICTDLRDAGMLLGATQDYATVLPHSWRSKARVFHRATPQWFIPMDALRDDGSTLRDKALEAIDRVTWLPEKSVNRIASMVRDRPDWLVSRQRAWGVPLALYVDKATGVLLRDPEVNERIVDLFERHGSDAWAGADHQSLLGQRYRAADYEVVNDVLDVWFDSGTSHRYAVKDRLGEEVVADLYLEGSDQHRGWFQSSLLASCGITGEAPYRAVLTHGFVLDQARSKMSKSDGNVVDPLKVAGDLGADVLRLWALSADYHADVSVGKETLAGATDSYKKLRNTLRYMLSALTTHDGTTVAHENMPQLEMHVLDRLAALDAKLRDSLSRYDMSRYVADLVEFSIFTLSSLFFDVRKDVLYCEPADSEKRRATLTVMDAVFEAMVRWIAPVLPFTADEAWLSRHPSEDDSVHLQTWLPMDPAWRSTEVETAWGAILAARSKATRAIELLRASGGVGSSEAALLTFPATDAQEEALLEAAGFADLCIVSAVAFVPDGEVRAEPTGDPQCPRCRRHKPMPSGHEECGRCVDAISSSEAA
jgi:isoleucyl-tRNA synthetase